MEGIKTSLIGDVLGILCLRTAPILEGIKTLSVEQVKNIRRFEDCPDIGGD